MKRNLNQTQKKSGPSYSIEKDGKEISVPFGYLPEITNLLDGLRGKDLTRENIHQIREWKTNRPSEITDETLDNLNKLKSLRKLDEAKTRDVLTDLLSTGGVGLPMASTYLRFLNPSVYQIIDERAFRAAYDFEPVDNYKNVKDNGTLIDIYIDYLNKLYEIEKYGYHGYRVQFEDLDRFLYDFDKFVGNKIGKRPLLKKGDIENKLEEWMKELDR